VDSTAGVLLSDDIPQVEWKAPPRAGRALLRATGARDQEKFQAAVEIDARPPSTDGMVWVPPGTFVRGDIHGTKNSTEVKTIQNACDEPYDSVYLDGFWIDRYPVTNRRYVRFLEECLAQGLIRPGGIAVMGELEGSWVPFYYFQSYEKLVPHHHEIRNPRKPEFLHVISFDGSRFHIKEGAVAPVVDVSWLALRVRAVLRDACRARQVGENGARNGRTKIYLGR
jgi:formylglycine-generating enzyme required for sulfatase activity